MCEERNTPVFWRMQDLPDDGVTTPEMLVLSYYFGENYMKMEEIGSKLGCMSQALFGCANDFNLFQNKTGRHLHMPWNLYCFKCGHVFPGEGVAKVYMPILVPVGVVGNVFSFLVGR